MRSPQQEAFDALSDPNRRAILQFLADHDEVTAGEIADHVDGVGRTAVSSHLRILRSSGLVTERRDGRYRRYALAPDGPVRDALGFLQGLLMTAISPIVEETAAVVAESDADEKAS